MLSIKYKLFGFIKKLFFFIFKISGWKINGTFPNLSKFVVIIAPHTTVLDFWYMLNVRIILELDWYYFDGKRYIRDVYWLAKKSLFKWPIEIIIRILGGIPVDRSKSNNIVDDLVKIANKKDTFVIGIAPDGTRKNKKNINFKWKSGFYYLAVRSNLPVISCFINKNNKSIFLSMPLFLSGVIDTDIKTIENFYKNGYLQS